MLPDFDALPVRAPRRVVPRLGGHWLGDPDADPLTSWTLQPEAVYRALMETGEALPDPALAEEDFETAYEWMRRMAAERLPTTGPGLFWVWSRVQRATILDCSKHARGEVLLTLRVPAKQVLLSEFDGWHMVLNDGFNVPPLPGESDEDWWKRGEPFMNDFDARADEAVAKQGRLTDELRLEKERSWEAIFDSASWRPDETIQGVAHSIRANQVVEAVRIR